MMLEYLESIHCEIIHILRSLQGLSGIQRSMFTSSPAESVADGLRAEDALKNMTTETSITSLESSRYLGES